MEKVFRGHVILIGQDNTEDCLIMSKDVPRGPKLDLDVMNMTWKRVGTKGV